MRALLIALTLTLAACGGADCDLPPPEEVTTPVQKPAPDHNPTRVSKP